MLLLYLSGQLELRIEAFYPFGMAGALGNNVCGMDSRSWQCCASRTVLCVLAYRSHLFHRG